MANSLESLGSTIEFPDVVAKCAYPDISVMVFRQGSEIFRDVLIPLVFLRPEIFKLYSIVTD